MASLQEWLAEQGLLTKYSLYITVFCTLMSTLGMISPMALVLNWTSVYKQLQLWRPITAMHYWGPMGGPKAFTICIAIYLTMMYSSRLETGEFKGRRADFVWMIVVTGLILLVASFFLDMMLLADARMMVFIWIWCRHNPEQPLSIMGMFQVKAGQFPFVLLAIHFLFGHDWVQDIVGILAGHFYIFCKDYVPVTYGIDILKTPQFVRRYLPDERVMGGFQTYAPQTRPINQPAEPTNPGTHSWGRGRTLGGNG